MSVFQRKPRNNAAPEPRRPRAWGWRTVSAAHLHSHPTCAACGSTKRVRAHHIIPVDVDASLELVPSNLITLCEGYEFGANCHLFFGHLGAWKRHNPFVVYHAARHAGIYPPGFRLVSSSPA